MVNFLNYNIYAEFPYDNFIENRKFNDILFIGKKRGFKYQELCKQTLGNEFDSITL